MIPEILEILNSLTIYLKTDTYEVGFFNQNTFKPGMHVYVPDKKKKWHLAVITTTLTYDIIAADILILLRKIVPNGEQFPKTNLPNKLKIELDGNIGVQTSKTLQYKEMEDAIFKGLQNADKVFHLISAFRMTYTVPKHAETDDKQIFLGALYCISAFKKSEADRVVGFYNMTYQTDLEVPEKNISGQILKKFVEKLDANVSNPYGIWETLANVWQAFCFYFPIPYHLENPTMKLCAILPVIGSNNAYDLTTSAYYDKKFGWLYPMNARVSGKNYNFLAQEFFLLENQPVLKQIEALADGALVSLFGKSLEYYEFSDDPKLKNYVKLKGGKSKELHVPKSIVVYHTHSTRSKVGFIYDDNGTGLRVLDKIKLLKESWIVSGIADDVRIFRDISKYLRRDKNDWSLQTRDEPRFIYGDIVSCVEIQPFTEGTIVQIRSIEINKENFPKVTYFEYCVFTEFGLQFYPEEILFNSALNSNFTSWSFTAPKPVSLPPSKGGIADTEAAGWGSLATVFGITTTAMKREAARNAVRAAFDEAGETEPLLNETTEITENTFEAIQEEFAGGTQVEQALGGFDSVLEDVGGSGIEMVDLAGIGVSVEGSGIAPVIESGVIAGESLELTEEVVSTGMSLWEVLGMGSTFLRFVTTPIFVGLETHTPEDLGRFMGVSGDPGFGIDTYTSRWMSGLPQWGSDEMKLQKRTKTEQKAIDAYHGKWVYFYNYGRWWNGVVNKVDFRESFWYPPDVDRLIKSSPREIAEELVKTWTKRIMFFEIKYRVGRNQFVYAGDVRDMRRIWLRDDERGTPPQYKDPYIIDTYLKEHENKEDLFSLGFGNDMQKIKRPDYTVATITPQIPEKTPEKQKPEPVKQKPEEGQLVPNPTTEAQSRTIPPEAPKKEETIFVINKEIEIFRPPVEYQDNVKTQLRYAMGTSAIFAIISLL